jgi:hypothetical protein
MMGEVAQQMATFEEESQNVPCDACTNDRI